MSIWDLIGEYVKGGGIVLIIVLTLIQITPIKINPWTKLAAAIGKAFNKDLSSELSDLKDSVNTLKDDVKKLDDKIKEDEAIDARVRILRFGDEVSHGQNHSKDHFQQMLMDITHYNKYCMTHPEFENSITKITAKRIEEDYAERSKKNNFL